MSRAIKFRVWDKKEKCYSDKAFSIDQLGICYVQDEDGYWEEINEERFIVEQYTGLKDKNGKEIYEGDIVRKYYYAGKDSQCLAVYFCQSEGQFQAGGFGLDAKERIEIIGNIHENPEFLEGEK